MWNFACRSQKVLLNIILIMKNLIYIYFKQTDLHTRLNMKVRNAIVSWLVAQKSCVSEN